MQELNHDIEQGDVFITPAGPIQVVLPVYEDDYKLTVTDPTCHYPQDSRTGTWEVEIDLLLEAIENGSVRRGKVGVVEADGHG